MRGEWELDRWDITTDYQNEPHVHKDPAGRFVRYDDHVEDLQERRKADQLEIARLRRRVAELEASVI